MGSEIVGIIIIIIGLLLTYIAGWYRGYNDR